MFIFTPLVSLLVFVFPFIFFIYNLQFQILVYLASRLLFWGLFLLISFPPSYVLFSCCLVLFLDAGHCAFYIVEWRILLFSCKLL